MYTVFRRRGTQNNSGWMVEWFMELEWYKLKYIN